MINMFTSERTNRRTAFSGTGEGNVPRCRRGCSSVPNPSVPGVGEVPKNSEEGNYAGYAGIIN